ncbi:hypothetical protein CDAR_102071 [Caerostris darwini]|uniref:Uncharacterized protein n=1 Tax=Caerostris darwini TaxID=1538125 RepID=A0AAV4MCG4_9ARAC|nr:hypothetical protein CDAR_102071 [Caerostris darwini]
MVDVTIPGINGGPGHILASAFELLNEIRPEISALKRSLRSKKIVERPNYPPDDLPECGKTFPKWKIARELSATFTPEYDTAASILEYHTTTSIQEHDTTTIIPEYYTTTSIPEYHTTTSIPEYNTTTSTMEVEGTTETTEEITAAAAKGIVDTFKEYFSHPKRKANEMKFARESEGFEVSHERLPPPTLEESQNILSQLKGETAENPQQNVFQYPYQNINPYETGFGTANPVGNYPFTNIYPGIHSFTEGMPNYDPQQNAFQPQYRPNIPYETGYQPGNSNPKPIGNYPFTNTLPGNYSFTHETPKYIPQQNVFQQHYQPNIPYKTGFQHGNPIEITHLLTHFVENITGLYPENPARNYPITDTFPGKYSFTDESPKYGPQQNEFQHQYQTSIPHETVFHTNNTVGSYRSTDKFPGQNVLAEETPKYSQFSKQISDQNIYKLPEKGSLFNASSGSDIVYENSPKNDFLNKSFKREYFTDKSFKEQPVLYKAPNIYPIPDQSSKIGQILKESPKNDYFIDKSFKRGSFINEPFEKGFITGKINEEDNLLPSKAAEKQGTLLKKSPVFNEGHITNEYSKDLLATNETEGIVVNTNSYENKGQVNNRDTELNNSTHFASNESMANQNDTKTSIARDVEFKRTNSESEIKNAASEVESRRNNVKLDLQNADFKVDENKARLANYFGNIDSGNKYDHYEDDMKRNAKDSQRRDFYSTLSNIIEPSIDSSNVSSTSGYQTFVHSTLGPFFKKLEIYDQLKEISLNTQSPSNYQYNSDFVEQRSPQRFNLKRNNINNQDKVAAEQYSPYFYPKSSGIRNRRIETFQPPYKIPYAQPLINDYNNPYLNIPKRPRIPPRIIRRRLYMKRQPFYDYYHYYDYLM